MSDDDIPPPKSSGDNPPPPKSGGDNPPPPKPNSSGSDADPFKAEPSNPYFIHHSDHPGLVLVSKLLNGDNFSGWKRSMVRALNSNNKLGFVNGSIKAPSEETDPEGYAIWSRCNDMVHSWIVNSCDPEIADSVTYYPNAHEVWEDLHEHTAHGAQADQQRLMQFLMGLNETYSAIRRQILLMNPLPTVRQAYAAISQEEKQLLSVSHTTSELDSSAAMAVRNSNRPNSNLARGGRFERSDRPQQHRPEGRSSFASQEVRRSMGRVPPPVPNPSTPPPPLPPVAPPPAEPASAPPEPAPEPVALSRSSRQTGPPVKLNDYICSNVCSDQSPSLMPGPTKEPNSYLEAVVIPEWRDRCNAIRIGSTSG
ncbi:PREDICTED: uncharacterized protein LOC101291796 [Fragaria vesca subsp. vesca]